MSCLPRALPSHVGVPVSALIAVLRRLKELDSLHSVMISRYGKVCLEAWWKPFDSEVPHVLFSLSKSFTSVAIGIARKEGRLKLSDRLISFFPEYESSIVDPMMREVTLRDLLVMGSGHAVCATAFMLRNPGGDWIGGFFSSRLERKPGVDFVYNSGGTYMLSAVIRRVTGENVREYLIPRLFAPTGMVPGVWEQCPGGIDCGGWGLYLTTEDIATFAELLRRGGNWNGEQLIPADYLAEATSVQINNSQNANPDWKCGYGYQFWLSRHGFRGDGANGQYAVVLPEEQMTIAVTGGVGDMQRILDVFWEELLPALKKESLPPASENENRELETLIGSLEIAPLRGLDLPGRRSRLFRFAPNPSGIEAIAVECGGSGFALTFFKHDESEQLRAGRGTFRPGVLRLSDRFAHPVLASGGWKSRDRLEIEVLYCDSSFRDLYRIDFAESTIDRSDRFGTLRPPFPTLKAL